MRAPSHLICLLLVALALPRAAAKPAQPAVGELAATLRRDLALTRAPGATWGVFVVHADSGAVWFATNQSRLLVPASNTKLFTVALALDRFGTDYRFRTDFAVVKPAGSPDADVGALWIRGGGVPFVDGPNSKQPFAPIVEFFEKRRIQNIAAGLVLDPSMIEASPYGSGWEWDDLQEPFAAPVGPFIWNANTAIVTLRAGPSAGQPAAVGVSPFPDLIAVDSRVLTSPAGRPARISYRRLPGDARIRFSGTLPAGTTAMERVAVPDAGLAFGIATRAALAAAHVRVSGPIRLATPGEAVPGVWESIPGQTLATLAADCMKPSDNVLAQTLLLQVGADVRRKPRPGEAAFEGDDEARGLAAMTVFLRRIGIGRAEAYFQEGSGLSRMNVVAPEATVWLLRHARRAPWGKAYIDALPVGGIDGTLSGRFTTGPARGNVRAKTGTHRHVSALAGYVKTAGGQPLVFAIGVNGFEADDASSAIARVEIDRLIEALAAFSGRGPE